MTTLKQKLIGVSIGLAGLTSCDNPTDITLTEGNVENLEIRYVRNVKWADSDSKSIEIYDSNGHLRAQFEPVNNGFIQYNDKKIRLEGGDVVKSSSSAEPKYNK